MAIITNNSFVSDNPLHAYRTYSYHHVLLACVDSTIVEEEFSNITSDKLLPEPDAIGNVSKRARPKYINNDINKPYVVLINTMVDTEFLIKSLTVNIIPSPPPVSALADNEYQYARSAFNSGGNLIIEEPFGVRFGDLLYQTCRNLRADPERIVFVLKTSFFGYSDQGATTIQQIKPLSIAFLSMDATFTAAGGHYEIEFVSYSNGFANRKELANIGGVAKFQVVDGKLSTCFKRFAEILNSEQKKVNESNPSLLPVNYEFILYEPFPEYIVTDVKAPNKSRGDEIQFNASINDSITVIIEKILMLSPQVREEFDKVSQTKPKTQTNPKTDRSVFKIYSDVKNTPKNITITYHIYPHKVATMPTPTVEDQKADPTILKQKRQDAIDLVFDEARENNNLLEYNYIYSGLNVDVLDFEMKLDLFTTYRMYYIEESSIDAKSLIKMETGAGTNLTGQKVQINLDEQPNSPKLQLFGIQPPALPSNISDAQNFYKYDQYLSRAVSFTDLSSFLTIAGDPRLYSGYLKTPIGKDGKLLTTDALSKDKQSVMSNWALTPSIVKMNIFMPTPPAGRVQDQTVQQAFAAPFWYDGAFQILSIVNTFGEDGKFIQRLELIQVPNDYNIADLTTYGDAPAGQTNGKTSNDIISAGKAQNPNANLIPPSLDSLTEEQQQCLLHAWRIANTVGMPPEILQGILLTDSQACKSRSRKVTSSLVTSNKIDGATTLTMSRVQNYLKTDPSPLQSAALKKLGFNTISVTDTTSLRLALTRVDDFNLRMCASIWVQDRNYWKQQFGTTSAVISERAIVGHNNITSINSNTPAEDLQVTFGARGQKASPSDEGIKQNGYLKLVESTYPLVAEFNSKLLPKLMEKEPRVIARDLLH